MTNSERPRQTGERPAETSLFVPTPDVFTVHPELLTQATAQVGFFMDEARRTPEERESVMHVVRRYLATRYRRSEELATDGVQNAVKWAREYFDETRSDSRHVHVELDLCMDRRVTKPHVLGAPGGFGNSNRFPGGRPEGFRPRGFGPGLELNPTSHYASHIRSMRKRYKTTVSVKDSHYHCRKATDVERSRTGLVPDEEGVREDRLYKREIILAEQALERPDEEVTHLQISFNPDNGFLDFLSETNIEEPALSMKEMAGDQLRVVFEDYKFEADLLNGYERTSETFWRNMLHMRDRGLPIMRKQLEKSFPKTAKDDPMKLEFMARFGLANAYNGYLNNLNPDGYPYSKHTEDLVVATIRGEDGPFPEAEAFEIFRKSHNLRGEALYAAGLVRDFRQVGSVETPVPLVLLYTIPEPSTETSELARRVARDLQESDWQNMTYEGVTKHIIAQYGAEYVVPAELTDAFAEMVGVMQNFYDRTIPDDFTTAVFRGGEIVPVPVIAGPHGDPVAVVQLTPKDIIRH